MNMPGAWAIRARSESATARLCFTPIMDKGSTQRDPAAAEEREAALAAREAAVAEREAAVSVREKALLNAWVPHTKFWLPPTSVMPSPTPTRHGRDTREQVLDRAHFLATATPTGTTYHCVGVPLLTGSTPRGIAQRHMTIALPSLRVATNSTRTASRRTSSPRSRSSGSIAGAGCSDPDAVTPVIEAGGARP